jgi:2-polyprenyl-3-methyl-5-hydroxy-6-metoxy-1,4-benzoquinol methylase
MEIKRLQMTWDQLGQEDPLWAILSDRAKRGNKWHPDEFFKTGEEQVGGILQIIESLGVPLSRDRALDFGCGVGRLSQALCAHFAACSGVDISPSMIQLAGQYNRYGTRCTYHLNGNPDLTLFTDNSFDFILTVQVLQHMKPEYSKSYIKEFLRVLKPGGVLFFQVPSGFVSEPSLPDSAFQLKIIPRVPPLSAAPARQLIVEATVKNAGDVAWTPSAEAAAVHAITFGYHWLDDGGKFLADGVEKVVLPIGLGPLAEVDLQLPVTTPTKPGDYVLELDIFQGGMGWFKDMGVETAKVPVEVEGAGESADCASSDAGSTCDSSGIEMYMLPKHEVLNLIAWAGGKVIDVQDQLDEEWISPYYIAVKGYGLRA